MPPHYQGRMNLSLFVCSKNVSACSDSAKRPAGVFRGPVSSSAPAVALASREIRAPSANAAQAAEKKLKVGVGVELRSLLEALDLFTGALGAPPG